LRIGILMLSDFRLIYSSRLWRAANVVCVLVVFSYVLFDLLDLDGSDFPRRSLRWKELIINLKAAKQIGLNHSAECAGESGPGDQIACRL